jgi:hypothetical protein
MDLVESTKVAENAWLRPHEREKAQKQMADIIRSDEWSDPDALASRLWDAAHASDLSSFANCLKEFQDTVLQQATDSPRASAPARGRSTKTSRRKTQGNQSRGGQDGKQQVQRQRLMPLAQSPAKSATNQCDPPPASSANPYPSTTSHFSRHLHPRYVASSSSSHARNRRLSPDCSPKHFVKCH